MPGWEADFAEFFASGAPALRRLAGGMGGGDLGVTATSLVTDSAGTGLLIVAVSRTTGAEAAQAQDHCTGQTAKAECHTGPNGETSRFATSVRSRTEPTASPSTSTVDILRARREPQHQ